MSKATRVRTDVAAIPIYRQVRDDLRSRLRHAEWQRGQKLPGRTRLAREYGVDTGTLQRAITALLDEGLLVADKRRGTFVSVTDMLPSDASRAPVSPSCASVVALLGPVMTVSSKAMSSSQFWLPAIHAIEARLSSEGHLIQFFNRPSLDGQWIATYKRLELAAESGLTAAIFVGAESGSSSLDEAVDLLHKKAVPVVTISDGILPYDVDQIYFDHQRMGLMCAQRLLKAGHKHIVFLATHDIPWVQVRALGVKRAFDIFEIPGSCLSIVPDIAQPVGDEEPDFEMAGYRAGKAVLKCGTMATAFIAANDIIGLGFVRATEEVGLRPGIDYNIIGFDGDELARTASLSTFHPPIAAMGQEAARIVLDALQGGHARKRIELSSEFISRASTQPIDGIVPHPLRYARSPINTPSRQNEPAPGMRRRPDTARLASAKNAEELCEPNLIE